MSLRRTITAIAAALSCLVTTLVGGLATGAPAGGQVTGPPTIRLLTQSPWAATRDTVSFTIEVDTDRAGTIDVVVEDALDDPATVDDDIDGRPRIRGTLTPLPVVAGRQVVRVDAVVVPTADGTPGDPVVLEDGVFPVRIALRDDRGTVTTLRTHLIHLDPATPRPLALVLPVAAPVAADGTIAVTALETVRTALDVVRSLGEIPLALHLSPQLVERLADERVGADIRTTLAALVAGGDAVLGTSYVPIDEAAWHAAGASDVVGWARNEATAVLDDAGLVADPEVWRLVGPATETALARSADAGAQVVVVDADALTGADHHVGAVTFDGAGPLRVVPATPATSADALRTDPVLAAHRTLATIAVAGGGQLLLPAIPEGTVGLADWSTYVRTLLGALARPDRPVTLRKDLGSTEPAVGTAATTSIATAAPVPGPSVDVGRARVTLATAAHVAGALASDPEPAVQGRRAALRALLVEPVDAAARLDAIAADLRTLVAAIDLPPRETVVVTSYRADVPVVLHNRSERPLRVRVQVAGVGVEVDDSGTFDVDVPPGVVEILVPVQTRRSGTFRLQVRVSTPDGGIELAQGTLELRSQAISGVGIALSAGAIAVLVAWWVRSNRQRRRNEHEPELAAVGTTGT